MSGALHPEQVDDYRQWLAEASAHLDHAAANAPTYVHTKYLQGKADMARAALDRLDAVRGTP